MGYLINIKKQRQLILVSIDLIALLLSAAYLTLALDMESNVLTLPFWGGVLVCLLYIFGAYNITPSSHRGMALVAIFMAISLSALSVYPFLSGPDRMRIGFLAIESLFLFVALGYAHIRISRMIEQRKPRLAIFFCSGKTYNRFIIIKPEVENDYELTDLIDARYVDSDRLVELFKKVGFSKPDIIVFDDSIPVDDEVAKLLLNNKSMGHNTLSFIDFCSAVTGRVPLEMVDFQWFVREGALKSQNVYSKRVKRVVDLGAGQILFLFSLVPMALVALAIIIEDGGPVLFRQKRLGQHGKEFILYKFRSMFNDAEKDGLKWTSTNDPRITRVGHFIRTTRLDELPQIINVIRGELSLVGPRPIRRHFTDIITEEYPLYQLRILVKPGVTGWAQVLGPYGVNMEEEAIKLEMDLYYLKNADLIHDLYVILKTVRIMVTGKGT